MSSESFPLDSSEPLTSPEELTANLRAAEQAFYDLPFDQDFAETCQVNGITTGDTSSPIYWQCIAQTASDICAYESERGSDPKRLILLELFAATPTLIYDSQQLSQTEDKTSAEAAAQTTLAKESVSYYNGLIRAAVKEWPDIRASVLAKSLMNIANASIDNPVMKQNAAGFIRKSVRGAQHELAFGQLLAATGYEFRPTTIREDLRGIDYVVTRPDGSKAYIDVKASLSEIEFRGQFSEFYVQVPDGRVITYSLLLDKELKDGFKVSEELATERCEPIKEMLDSVQRLSRAS